MGSNVADSRQNEPRCRRKRDIVRVQEASGFDTRGVNDTEALVM